jgi:predicted component of type VI protein secretion system
VKAQAQLLLVPLSEGANIPLDKPIILIGRHQECDIQIPSRKISRRHCCIAMLSDHLVIRDLGSTNGVRINGIKVVEGNLQPNDELTIGNMRYRVKWNGEDEQTMRSEDKNGIRAGEPPMSRPGSHDESREEPIPLADDEHAHVALPGQPTVNANVPTGSGPPSLGIPDADHINLIPLDPPSN